MSPNGFDTTSQPLLQAAQTTFCYRMSREMLMHCFFSGLLVGWLGFNDTLSTQVAAISCLKKFKVY